MEKMASDPKNSHLNLARECGGFARFATIAILRRLVTKLGLDNGARIALGERSIPMATTH